MRSLAFTVPLLALLTTACPGSSNDDGDGVTGNTGQTAPVTVSAEDGPEPVTCESLGGTCSCAGACDPGQMLSTQGTCPQPPDESGACSQDCCVPVAGTTAGTTAATAGSTAADSTAAGTAETGPPVCDCASLPLCATPPDEDCNGQYPEEHCCDDMAAAMTCSCLEPCDGGFPCCTLQPGCD